MSSTDWRGSSWRLRNLLETVQDLGCITGNLSSELAKIDHCIALCTTYTVSRLLCISFSGLAHFFLNQNVSWCSAISTSGQDCFCSCVQDLIQCSTTLISTSCRYMVRCCMQRFCSMYRGNVSRQMADQVLQQTSLAALRAHHVVCRQSY